MSMEGVLVKSPFYANIHLFNSDASSPDALTTLIMIPNGTSKRMLGQKIVMQWGSDEEEPAAGNAAAPSKEKKEKKAPKSKQ